MLASNSRSERKGTFPIGPLLPIEKIGWSLGIAIALLVVLIAVNHFVPIKL
ncbi:MAG TPA: hypothetical protein VGL45_04215 [Bradyrhizobium sp.]|jgi:hypothetical protein